MRQRRNQVAACGLVGVVLLYVITFTALSIARYDAFHASTFDLGFFSQVVWNTAHGHWFETSISRATNVELIGSYLGEHVNLILLLMAPLYRLWADPRLLLVLQSVALGTAAIPLYWLAHRWLGDSMAALIVACCYLTYPALGFINLFDVHPVAFSIPFVFLAAWALSERRFVLFWCGVLLALSTKEELVIPFGVWGLVNLLQRQRRRIGWGLLALSGTWAVVCFGLIIPYFGEGQPYRFWQLWSHLPGFSVQPSVRGGVAQPTVAASPEAVILFLTHLALPLGPLPFLGPASLLVALPSFVYLLLGGRAALHSVGYHYPAVLIPWLFLAVVEGLQRLRRKAGRFGSLRLYRLGLAFLLIGTIGANVPFNPVFLYARAGAFCSDPYHAQVLAALAQIPPEAGIAVVNRLGPPVANRRILVALDYPPPLRLDHVQLVDYVLLDLVDCRTVPSSDPRIAYADIVAQVLQTGRFRVRYWSGRILLLERGTPTEEESAAVLAYVADLVDQNRPCWP